MIYNFKHVIDFEKEVTEKGVRHIVKENGKVLAESAIYEDKGYLAAVVIKDRFGKFKIEEMFKELRQIGRSGRTENLVKESSYYAVAVDDSIVRVA